MYSLDKSIQLLQAVKNGDLRKVGRLLKQKADPNATTQKGNSALQLAVSNALNNRELIGYFIGHMDFTASIRNARCWNNVHAGRSSDEIPDEWIERYCQLKELGWEDAVCLDKVVDEIQQTSLLLLKALLKRGADPNPATGKNPLHMAAEAGWLEGCELLCQYGASIYVVKDAEGNTAFHHSVIGKQLAVLQYFCKKVKKADLGSFLDSLKNRRDETLLELAVNFNHAPMVEFLLQQGVNPRSNTHQGTSVFYKAIMNVLFGKDFAIAHMLHLKGAVADAGLRKSVKKFWEKVQEDCRKASGLERVDCRKVELELQPIVEKILRMIGS